MQGKLEGSVADVHRRRKREKENGRPRSQPANLYKWPLASLIFPIEEPHSQPALAPDKPIGVGETLARTASTFNAASAAPDVPLLL